MAVTNKYGLSFSVPIGEIELELSCFRANHTPDKGGLGRYGHFRQAASLMWPKMVWHPWLERQIQSLCDNKYVGWAGCAASGKTYGATLFGMIWWLGAPSSSAVILTSTTAKMIRKRQWSALQDLRLKCPAFPGHVVDSKTMLQVRQGDDKHGIFALPVMEGSMSKAAANIQGIHAQRILVIIDEATDTPEAIFEAVTNLEKGCSEFQMLVIGNPNSYFDQHGRFCEPKEGWKSVGVEDDEWETRRGVCLRFDGQKTPNMAAGKGKPIYPFLISKGDVDQAREYEGTTSPTYWKYTRGFWSPEGVSKNVISETMCVKFNTQQKIVFTSRVTTIAGLDPAFGGDRCILRFANLGDNQDGKSVVQFTDIVPILLDASSPEPIAYQISRRVIDECKSRGVEPENLAIDSTGNGAGVADVIAVQWAPHFHRVSFASVASDMAASPNDPRPARDAYENKVTELWYSFREWMKADQIRGLDSPTIRELCSRFYIDEKRKLVVEPKKEMKVRTGESPDLADAACLVIEIARRMGHMNPVIGKGKGPSSWEAKAKASNEIYVEENLYTTAYDQFE